jgi:hypothetical protein
VETIIELCRTRLPENMKIAPMDIQVLSPTRHYDTGTESLNKRLQQALNPPSGHKKEKRFGEIIFREGDRVMQIRNNYDIIWKKTSVKSDDPAGAGRPGPGKKTDKVLSQKTEPSFLRALGYITGISDASSALTMKTNS